MDKKGYKIRAVPRRGGKKIEIRAMPTENRHGPNPGIYTRISLFFVKIKNRQRKNFQHDS